MKYKGDALKLAIDALRVPALIHNLRSEPLPEGVDLILAISAGDSDAENEAILLAEHDLQIIRKAAIFFIQQVLFYTYADHYRVLGVERGADREELRHNFTSLMRWLHPDLDQDDGHAVFLARVVEAWNTLKSPKSRAEYDTSLMQGSVDKTDRHRSSLSARFKTQRRAKQIRKVLPRRGRMRGKHNFGRVLLRFFGTKRPY